MENHTISCHDLKKFKKIRFKATNKYESSRRNCSSSNSYCSLSGDSGRDELIQTYESKDMNGLDHSGNDNINNKDQCNDAVEHDKNLTINLFYIVGLL